MKDARKMLSIALARLAYRAHRVNVFQNYHWLRQTETWSPQQRESWRLERLNRVLQFTWETVAFYRDFWTSHGLQWRPLRHLTELQAYPVLRKETFREHWRQIRPPNFQAIPHIRKHTGGTTGRPVHYLLDREQWAVMHAFLLWGWSLAGYSFGDPVGVLTGGSLMPERVTLFERFRNFTERRLFLFGVQMDRKLAHAYHARLEQYGARFLYGYPSILYLFCRFLAEDHLRLPQVRAVITTAEMLLPHYREGIEAALDCRVFDDYGCNDGGFESFECSRHRGWHYNDLQSILELGDPDQHGFGTLVVTNLWNRSTPFIRYENGDRISLAGARCACGSKFPLIDGIEGRSADILHFSNGQSFVCPPHLFGDMDIDGWQVVQTEPAKVEVRLAKAGALDHHAVSKVERVMRHHLSEPISIEVKHVEALAVTRNGKLKPVWSEVNGKPEWLESHVPPG